MSDHCVKQEKKQGKGRRRKGEKKKRKVLEGSPNRFPCGGMHLGWGLKLAIIRPLAFTQTALYD